MVAAYRAVESGHRNFSRAHHPEVRIQDKVYGTERMFTLIVGEEILHSFQEVCAGKLVAQ